MQPGMLFSGVESKIILIGVIVSQVDVSILEQAVRGHEIKGFIPSKRDALGDEDGGSSEVEEKANKEKEAELTSDRKREKSFRPALEIRGFPSLDAARVEDLEKSDRHKHKKSQKAEPHLKVFLCRVKSKKPGSKEEKAKRERSEKPSPEAGGL